MHQRQHGFHALPIIVILAVIVVAGLIVWRVWFPHMVVPLPGSHAFAGQYNCKERDVQFTSPPLKMEHLGYIRPLGAMLDSHVTPTDHVYVAPIKSDVPDNTYPVLMPGDGTIVEVARMPEQYIGDLDVTLPQEDHRIIVSHNCRYFSVYIHIHKLADSVKAQVGELKAGENKRVSVDLKAGDTFGYIGGSTFDWTPVDIKTTLTGFINPSTYKDEPWKIHTVSPFDWYTGDLKAQLEAKSLRSTPPIGGKIDYDQPGKLIGNWFRSGTGGYKGQGERYWSGHLAVVPDYIDPDYIIVSTGDWEGRSQQFLVKGNVNPAHVSSSDGVVKYELQKFSYASDVADHWDGHSPARGLHPTTDGELVGTILFQVEAGEKIKVEKFPGKTASQVNGFTSAAQTYER